jgi:hypothetical protein
MSRQHDVLAMTLTSADDRVLRDRVGLGSVANRQLLPVYIG